MLGINPGVLNRDMFLGSLQKNGLRQADQLLPTVTRIPLIQGLPPIRFGLNVILSKIIVIYFD